MNTRTQLRRLRRRAADFVHSGGMEAEQLATEIGLAVAKLDGVLHDDGKSIAFGADILLNAPCLDIRSVAFEDFQAEINTAIRELDQ